MTKKYSLLWDGLLSDSCRFADRFIRNYMFHNIRFFCHQKLIIFPYPSQPLCVACCIYRMTFQYISGARWPVLGWIVTKSSS